MSIQTQGAKPNGLLGRLIGILMNRLHTNVYAAYFRKNPPKNIQSIGDIGCGGGRFIYFLCNVTNAKNINGIDHSKEMVELARKTNKKAIASGKVIIEQSNVDNLPWESKSMDMVCAMECIQFWPNIEKTLSQLVTILKEDGSLFIFNRYPKEGSKWWKIAKIKSDIAYRHFLTNAGFKELEVGLEYKKGWIVVKATA